MHFWKPYLNVCLENIMSRIYCNPCLADRLLVPWLTGNVVIKTSAIMNIIWHFMNITLNYCNAIRNIYLFVCRIILVSSMSSWLKCLSFIYNIISISGHRLPETQDHIGFQPTPCFSVQRYLCHLWSQWCYPQWPHFTSDAKLLMRTSSGLL